MCILFRCKMPIEYTFSFIIKNKNTLYNYCTIIVVIIYRQKHPHSLNIEI